MALIMQKFKSSEYHSRLRSSSFNFFSQGFVSRFFNDKSKPTRIIIFDL